jgi:hypothetical protein
MATQSATPVTRFDLSHAVLQANGVFSSICGLILVTGAGPLTTMLGLITPAVPVVIGVLLVGYAALLLWTAARPTVSRVALLEFAIIDVLWVVTSAVLLVTSWAPLTTAGVWTVAVIADIVAVFAAVQFYAAWRLR